MVVVPHIAVDACIQSWNTEIAANWGPCSTTSVDGGNKRVELGTVVAGLDDNEIRAVGLGRYSRIVSEEYTMLM